MRAARLRTLSVCGAALLAGLAAARGADKPPAEGHGRLEKYLSVRHPRLLVTPERLALIRRQIRVPGSHFQLAHAAMVERARGDPQTVWRGDARAGYWPVYASRELAFLSLVAEDGGEKRRYAAAAAKCLPTLDYVRWFGFKSRSLGHAMATFGVALTYDWAYNAWTDAEREKAEVLLEYFLKHWETYRRVSEDRVTGYNFYGVLYGAETMLLLATGSERTSKRYPVCVDVLARHLADIGGELGAHNEGIGYSEYPMGFALPAAIALAQHGQDRPLTAARSHAFWTLNMVVQTFMSSYERKFVQYGVAHRSGANEGFASLVLALCPAERMPYYLWFYDRHMGRLATAEAADRFDRHRGNTPFALLFYPADVAPKDPTGVLPKAVADRDGYIFFRNRWRDANDVQVALLASVRRSGGWSQNEHLNLRLMAFDTHFFGGPGKERGVENYTTLLIDGENAPGPKAGQAGFQPGQIAAFEPDADGGYAIVDGGGHYRAMGVTRAARHLLVHFASPEAGSAVLATMDDITSDAEHTYTWQANLGPEGHVKPPPELPPRPPTGPKVPSLDAGGGASADQIAELFAGGAAGKGREKPETKPVWPPPNPYDDGIRSTSAREAGRPCFLLTGRNRGFVKGWVLHPPDATVTVGDPLRIEAKAASTKIWIVMFAGMGDPPVAAISGQGTGSRIKIGGTAVRWDATKGRILCE